MRRNLNRKHFTKSERVLGEALKRHRIPFRAKENVAGREVDFLIGNIALEVNGHDQKPDKNGILLELGYIPMNVTNGQVLDDVESVISIIKHYGTFK